jgi:hypothetical protein
MKMTCEALAIVDVATWQKIVNQENNLTTEKEEWFVCSFCYEIVINKPSIMIGTNCVCELCKADDKLVDEFIELNEIYDDHRIESYEDFIASLYEEPEYRGEKKEDSDDEEIDITLYENFKESTFSLLNGEGEDTGDDEE